MHKTIDASLRQGGWLTPVYASRQVIPEYLFLVDHASHRDHQFKLIEKIITHLKHNGVLITSYYFDGDPRICFVNDSDIFPQKLKELAAKYPQYCLVIVLDAEKLFSTYTGELESWISQLENWDKRAILTPKPVENWGYQELELAQNFIVLPIGLPSMLKGIQLLTQVLHQGTSTYLLPERVQIPLPEPLRIRPHHWLDRNPPISEQIDALLVSLQEYLGKNNFYWLCACAVFPELHWNITIYLGNVLKTEEGHSLLEVYSLASLARLPWFRYGYIPNWLRVRLISSLTRQERQTIRTVLQDLLVVAIQGSVDKLHLEVAKQHHSWLPNLANAMLLLLLKKVSSDSALRDYLFLSFMTRQPKLAFEVPDNFRFFLHRHKRIHWLIKIGIILSTGFFLSTGLFVMRQAELNQAESLGRYSQSLFSEGKELDALVVAVKAGKILQNQHTTNLEVMNALQEVIDRGSERNRLEGHTNYVRSVSFSPDGKTLASGSADNTIELTGLGLDNLMVLSCDWVRNYLTYNPHVSESDRHLCDGIGTKK